MMEGARPIPSPKMSVPRIFFLPQFLGCGTHHFLRSGGVLYLRWRIWDKGRAMGGGCTSLPGYFQTGVVSRFAHQFGEIGPIGAPNQGCE